MKIALLTDTHWGARQDNSNIIDYFGKFYTDVFFPYMDEHKIKNVIHLGDVFDRRKYTNHVTLRKSRQLFFDPLVARGIEMDIILGNHDSAYRNTLEVNSPNLLLNDYNFKLFHEPEYAVYDGLKILMLPWITPETQTKSFDMIGENKASIIMGHLEIQGYEMLRGKLCDHGLNMSIFEAYLSVFSGHFHFKSFSNGIMYLGTPYEMTWGDYGTQKGFHVLDTETLTLDFVENPFKLFHKVSYDDTETVPDIDTDALEGAYVKVMVQHKNNPSAFEKFMDKLNKSKAHNVIVVEEPLFRADATAADGTFEVEDTLTFMKKYIRDTESLPIAKDRIVSLVENLYRQANELEL